MRVLPVALLALLAACSGAQGGGAPGATIPQSVMSAPSPGGSVIITRDNQVYKADVGATPADVWPLVAQAYADIGFLLDNIDNGARVATATNQRVRRLAGKQLSTYFNCAGPFGNTANRDDVFVTVRTEVVPGNGGGSIVRIGVGAVSRPTTAANTITDCGSTGELERLVINTIIGRAVAK